MALSLAKLKTIAIAKFSDKSNLGDWYKKRLEICEQCPLNSAVKKAQGEELSASQKLVVAANLGKPTCLACGCEIAAKASVESEQCGLVKIGQEPLWGTIEHVDGNLDYGLALEGSNKIDTLRVFNHNPDKAQIHMTGDGILVDYGVVPHAYDSKITIELESKSGDIQQCKVSAGCGCTNVTGTVIHGKALVTLGYDTVGRKGPVTKTFNVNYKVGGKVRVLIGKLKINVEAPETKTK